MHFLRKVIWFLGQNWWLSNFYSCITVLCYILNYCVYLFWDWRVYGCVRIWIFLVKVLPSCSEAFWRDSLANNMDSSTDTCRLLLNCLVDLAVCSITWNFAWQAGRKNWVYVAGIGFGGSRSTVFHAERMCLVQSSLKLSNIAHCFTVQKFKILSSFILKAFSSTWSWKLLLNLSSFMCCKVLNYKWVFRLPEKRIVTVNI